MYVYIYVRKYKILKTVLESRITCLGFSGWLSIKNLPASVEDARDVGLIPGVEKIPWRRKWQLTLVLFLGLHFAAPNQTGFFIKQRG